MPHQQSSPRQKPTKEVILEIGAEGGSLTILGICDPECGWQFLNERNETTFRGMLPEEEEKGLEFYERSGYVASFAEALASLDRYPWHKLYPVQAHPEFHQRIFDVVVSRFEAEGGDRWDQLSRWREVCGMPDR
jgi:hypothetical protein